MICQRAKLVRTIPTLFHCCEWMMDRSEFSKYAWGEFVEFDVLLEKCLDHLENILEEEELDLDGADDHDPYQDVSFPSAEEEILLIHVRIRSGELQLPVAQAVRQCIQDTQFFLRPGVTDQQIEHAVSDVVSNHAQRRARQRKGPTPDAPWKILTRGNCHTLGLF